MKELIKKTLLQLSSTYYFFDKNGITKESYADLERFIKQCMTDAYLTGYRDCFEDNF